MPKISDKRNLHRDPETWVNCACEQCTKPIRQTQAVMCYVCQDEHQHWVCSAFCNQRFMKSGDKRVKELKHMSKVRLNGFLMQNLEDAIRKNLLMCPICDGVTEQFDFFKETQGAGGSSSAEGEGPGGTSKAGKSSDHKEKSKKDKENKAKEWEEQMLKKWEDADGGGDPENGVEGGDDAAAAALLNEGGDNNLENTEEKPVSPSPGDDNNKCDGGAAGAAGLQIPGISKDSALSGMTLSSQISSSATSDVLASVPRLPNGLADVSSLSMDEANLYMAIEIAEFSESVEGKKLAKTEEELAAWNQQVEVIADAIEQRDADDKIVEIVEGFSQKLYDQLKSRYQRFREAAELHKLNKHAFHIEFEVVKKDEEEGEGAAKKEKGGRQLSEIEKKREQKALEKKQRAKEDAERKERVREEKERQEAELKRERAKLRGEGGLVGAAAEGNSNGKSPSRGENIIEHSFPALAGSSSSPPGAGDQQRPDSAGAKKKKKSANAGAFKYDKKVLDTVVRQLAELLGEPIKQEDGDDENWEESWFLDRLRQHNLDLAAYVTETARSVAPIQWSSFCSAYGKGTKKPSQVDTLCLFQFVCYLAERHPAALRDAYGSSTSEPTILDAAMQKAGVELMSTAGQLVGGVAAGGPALPTAAGPPAAGVQTPYGVSPPNATASGSAASGASTATNGGYSAAALASALSYKENPAGAHAGPALPSYFDQPKVPQLSFAKMIEENQRKEREEQQRKANLQKTASGGGGSTSSGSRMQNGSHGTRNGATARSREDYSGRDLDASRDVNMEEEQVSDGGDSPPAISSDGEEDEDAGQLTASWHSSSPRDSDDNDDTGLEDSDFSYATAALHGSMAATLSAQMREERQGKSNLSNPSRRNLIRKANNKNLRRLAFEFYRYCAVFLEDYGLRSDLRKNWMMFVDGLLERNAFPLDGLMLEEEIVVGEDENPVNHHGSSGGSPLAASSAGSRTAADRFQTRLENRQTQEEAEKWFCEVRTRLDPVLLVPSVTVAEEEQHPQSFGANSLYSKFADIASSLPEPGWVKCWCPHSNQSWWLQKHSGEWFFEEQCKNSGWDMELVSVYDQKNDCFQCEAFFVKVAEPLVGKWFHSSMIDMEDEEEGS